MLPTSDSFAFDYFGSELVYGRGCIDRLGERMDAFGYDRALVVCGSNVGANRDLMDPIRESLGDRLAGVFDETTPEKRIETAFDGIDRMRDVDPDVVVAVGGGSSLDVGRQMTVFAAGDRSQSDIRESAREGSLEPPESNGPLVPVFVVPTTFAGADISSGGSIEVLSAAESPTGAPIRTKGSNMPEAMFYDPNLYETTPESALAGSAMNGFNKGLETVYSKDPTAVTDATSVHGLRLLSDSFPHVPGDADAMERAVTGSILVQFRRRPSVAHAFGHGFSQRYPVQQGTVHAIVIPHVLRYLFDKIDARRALLAQGLEVDTASRSDEAVGAAIVDSVAAVRDSFDLPTRLRELDPVDPDDFSAIAESIVHDRSMKMAPPSLEPTVAEIEEVLDSAW